MVVCVCCFFFSSRRRHTRWTGDWSSDVCSSDLDVGVRVGFAVSMKDRNPIGYGPPEPLLDALPQDAREEIVSRFVRPPLAPKDYIKLVEDVAAAADGDR